MVRCRRCGKENPDINTWCNSCGADLSAPDFTKTEKILSGPLPPEGASFPDAQIPTYYRTFKSSIRTCMKEKYAQFSGRATRSEYWFFYLFNLIITSAIYVVLFVFLSASDFWGAMLSFALMIMYLIAFLVPNISVAVRRLHDIGRSGWWLLIGLIPYIGAVVLFVLFILDSQPCDNRFGLAPQESK